MLIFDTMKKQKVKKPPVKKEKLPPLNRMLRLDSDEHTKLKALQKYLKLEGAMDGNKAISQAVTTYEDTHRQLQTALKQLKEVKNLFTSVVAKKKSNIAALKNYTKELKVMDTDLTKAADKFFAFKLTLLDKIKGDEPKAPKRSNSNGYNSRYNEDDDIDEDMDNDY